MVPYLLEKWVHLWSGFNALQYISSRSILALVWCFLISVWVFPSVIRLLQARNIGQMVRDDGPQTHLSKMGTPTMGGLVIVGVSLLSVLVWARWNNPYLWLMVVHTAAFATIGFADDFLKLSHQNPQGLKGSVKLVLSSLILAIDIFWLVAQGFQFYVALPFFKNAWVFSPFLVIPFIFVVVIGTAHAANLTDGLDGLLAGILMIVLTTIGALCYVAGHKAIADYLYIPYTPGAGELTVFAACLIGSVLGFLWYNCHPASIFMGDGGALSIGAAVGLISVIIRSEFLLLLCAGVMAAEAISVILQVSGYKLFKRRLFRMAPLHHHFELKGWAENQVIVRFWIVTFLLGILTLVTLKLR
jgi:phospho-N-acetylmuramoyl-pentapeptide-transferase